jgi:hypothetical protein
MKSFIDYLNENYRVWPFKVKVAGPCDQQQIDSMETLLSKFGLSQFKKSSTTPIQELPLDFPRIKNAEVTIFDISLDYPATQWEIHECLANGLGITKDRIVVKSPNEPSEQYQNQQQVEPREGALLDDPDYKESPNHEWDDFYGDKYNGQMIKELNDLLKLERRNRNEKIPSSSESRYQNSGMINTRSPLPTHKK